jgi:hypothetical protein
MEWARNSHCIGEPPARACCVQPGFPGPVGLAETLAGEHSAPYRIGLIEQFFGMDEQDQGQGSKRLWGVASDFPTEGTMRAPMPTPEGLPAQAAIIIMGCLFVFLAALWLFVITKAMIAIGIGAVALFTAGACAFAHRYALKPL